MSANTHTSVKVISVIAATCIALACGTNYAYSAWAPQFAHRMHLSATQSNIIGVAGNIGMYASGIPCGMLVDRKGPRPGALLGGLALGAGYFPIHGAYVKGAGSMGMILLFFLSFLTGMGSCAAFQAALKTAATNWPNHRGTATGIPLAAFGLSAFFYTTLSAFFFPDDTQDLLAFLTYGTSCLIFISLPFLKIIEYTTPYTPLLPAEEDDSSGSSNIDRSTTPSLARTEGLMGAENWTQFPSDQETENPPVFYASEVQEAHIYRRGHPESESIVEPKLTAYGIHGLDVTGFALLPKLEFWQLWCLLGLLTGVGLMTINNIGNDVASLWSHYDDSADGTFITKRQLLHVSIISIMSFIGRLLSGIGSDILVKRLFLSRYWCVAASAIIFMIAQICAIRIENPNLLWAVSGSTGLAYGALFGVFPALVADTFGVSGFSVNWGFMTLAPVVSGNIFNLCYGLILDHHSTILPGGQRHCADGLACYGNAYWITFVSSIMGIAFALWGIKHEHMLKKQLMQDDHRER